MNSLSQLLALCFISTFLIGCGEKDPRRMKSGEELYNYYCAQCHKEMGLGAYFELFPQSRRPIQAYEVVLMIKYGYSQGHSMPLYDQLNDKQADTVAEYSVMLRATKSPEQP